MGNEDMSEEEAQGRLVKQLLETKKDLEGGSQRETTDKIETVRFEKALKSHHLGRCCLFSPFFKFAGETADEQLAKKEAARAGVEGNREAEGHDTNAYTQC